MDTSTSISSMLKPTLPVSDDATMTTESKKISPDVVDVLIAGAGIGGLVTALCLHRAGFSVRIHERVPVLEPIGFGVNLQPYAVKVLYELGFEPELDAIGIRVRSYDYYSRNGQFIYNIQRGIDAVYNCPAYSLHRGHFQQILLRHVHDEIGEASIRLSQKLIAFRLQPNHVEIDFVNPITGELTTELAKVLVGADGINSTVRKILYPNEGPPLWSGLTVWRGVSPVDKILLDGQTLVNIGNPDECFLVVYHVNRNLVNWVCILRDGEPGIRISSVTPDWNHLGRIEDVLRLLSDMKIDFLDIDHLIKSSITVNQFPMTDRDVLPRWTHERVTLLGDAAHPMYTFGANGASQAILDAQALSRCLGEHGVIPQGLQVYDDLRRLAANSVVLADRNRGPVKPLRVVGERSQSSLHQLSDVNSTSEIQAIVSDYMQQSGWNTQQVNKE